MNGPTTWSVFSRRPATSRRMRKPKLSISVAVVQRICTPSGVATAATLSNVTSKMVHSICAVHDVASPRNSPSPRTHAPFESMMQSDCVPGPSVQHAPIAHSLSVTLTSSPFSRASASSMPSLRPMNTPGIPGYPRSSMACHHSSNDTLTGRPPRRSTASILVRGACSGTITWHGMPMRFAFQATPWAMLPALAV